VRAVGDGGGAEGGEEDQEDREEWHGVSGSLSGRGSCGE
jgi:hypothetical protein